MIIIITVIKITGNIKRHEERKEERERTKERRKAGRKERKTTVLFLQGTTYNYVKYKRRKKNEETRN